jgi:Holliday junction DNA helicase RuvB
MNESLDIRGNRYIEKDKEFDNQLRPVSFVEFGGQKKTIENLQVFVKAARQRGESLDYYMVLQDWEKLPYHTLLRLKWE